MSFTTKALLRQHYRHLRHQLSLEQKTFSSQAITNIFFNNFFWISRSMPRDGESGAKKNISVYLAHDGEINLQPLIEALWEKQHNIFLPVLDSMTRQLRFVLYSSVTAMKKNQYGIDEPEDVSTCILPHDLDIVLLPLVAFDNAGTRLGMGKGYYDKSFSFCREKHNKPQLIGVAYECQRCLSLPADEWDVPLDGILTETTLLKFKEA